ncbi:MAG: hypothetical protein AAGI03_00365 [Pseudomonadota bacterium]
MKDSVEKAQETGEDVLSDGLSQAPPDKAGAFVEHHWQMTMSPIVRDGNIVAVMQVAKKDVTENVL